MRRLPSTPQYIQQKEIEERGRRIIKGKFISLCITMGVGLITVVVFTFFNSDFWDDAKAKANDLDCEVTFLDMEYGESVILECEENYALIDCGTEKHTEELLGFLNSKGINRLDYYFVSDICEGYSEVFKNVLNCVVTSSVILPSNESDNPLRDEIEDIAFVNGKNAVSSNQGSAFGLHRMGVSIIDAQSLSLYLKFGNHAFVIWNSDDEERSNEIVKSKPWINADVLKLKDGAKVGKGFLEISTPQIFVVDSAESSDLQGFAEKIYITDTQGNIVIRSDEVDLEILENQ